MRGFRKTVIALLMIGLCACNKEVNSGKIDETRETIVPKEIEKEEVKNPTNSVEIILPKEDEIPLTSDLFSSTVMLDYLKVEVDYDQNGFLSASEREKITELFFDPRAGSAGDEVFDGFEFFPNLTYVVLPRCEKAVFMDCPSLIAVSGNETDAYGELVFEHCPNLVSCGTLFHAARNLSVKDCKALRYAYSYDSISLRYIYGKSWAPEKNKEEVWRFEAVNDLELYGNSENLPDRIVADASEVTFVTYDHSRDACVWNDDFEVDENGTLLIGGKNRIEWINKEAYADAVLPTKEELEKLITKQSLLPEKSGKINRISLLSYSLKNGVAYAVETGDELLVIAVGTNGVCRCYASLEEWECEKTGPVSIDSAHFGSEAFCEFIRMFIDENKDGVLSKEERLAVTEIILAKIGDEFEFAYWEKSDVVRGLELFPNLKNLCTDNVETLILQNHPSLERYTTGDSHLGRLFVENCSSLKEISFSLVYGKSNLYVKNCRALETVENTDMGIEDAIELVRTPKLVINRELLYGKYVTLDRNVSFWPEKSVLPLFWER